jgi:hypothetical protein
VIVEVVLSFVAVGSVVIFIVVELDVGFFSGTIGFFVGNMMGLIGLPIG